MILLIECIVACALFSAVILPSVYRNPIDHVMSYPTKIRKRVESLPEYQGMIKNTEKKGICRKIIGALISLPILSAIAYFSGAKTFADSFWHIFIIFQSINIFDVIVLDMGLFCHSKKTMIKGTEDMIEEYRNPKHHIIGGFWGLLLGTIVSLLSAFLVHLFNVRGL